MLQMYNSCQKFICPPDDTAVKYTTSYTLHPHDDGQQYMVLKDYHLHLAPAIVTVELGNLYSGNKMLGELEKSRTSKYDHSNARILIIYLSVCLKQRIQQIYQTNLGPVMRDVGPKTFESFCLITHNTVTETANSPE